MRSAARARSIAFVTVLLLSFALGCGTVRLEVPPGARVRLLQEDEPAQIHVQRTVWFWLFGARPFGDNSTRTEIEKYHLCEIRMRTTQSMTDNLTNLVTILASIVRRTLIVDGNSGKDCVQAPAGPR